MTWRLRTDHLHLVKKRPHRRYNGRTTIEWDPTPSPIPAHRHEEEGQSGEGIGAQELRSPGPGDQLWEHKSALHWVLVTSRAWHQGHLEHSGKAETPTICGEQHVPLALLRPKTEAEVWKLCQQWEGYQRDKGWMELSPQEKGQVDDTSPALPQPDGSDTGAPNTPFPLLQVQPWGTFLHTTFSPQQAQTFAAWQVERDFAVWQADTSFPSFLSPTWEAPVGGSSKCSFLIQSGPAWCHAPELLFDFMQVSPASARLAATWPCTMLDLSLTEQTTPECHVHHTHLISPMAPSSLQGPASNDPSRSTAALLTKGWLRCIAIWWDWDHCQQTERHPAHRPPIATGPSKQSRTMQWRIKSLELLGTKDTSS